VSFKSNQTSATKNDLELLRICRENLKTLKIGMTKDEVLKHMGQPETWGGYKWGPVWLYWTDFGTADSDFTPVVFDEDGKLFGWSKDDFIWFMDRYGINVKLTLPHLLYHYELEYPALIDTASTGLPVENFSFSSLKNSSGVRFPSELCGLS